jgi:phosphoribosylaminoimidazolecarboxamide formyltransferase/IMP cyclohydrolase
MEGRVKTLHPRIHGGILARQTDEHLADLERVGAELIDLVVVNLYPFERTAANRSAALAELVEQIDIGGPCLLRAAAKNFERVTVVCDPNDYETVLWGEVPAAQRFDLALKAFGHTAAYDAAIARELPAYDLVSGKRRGGSR